MQNEIPSKLRPLFEDPHIHNVIQGGRGGGKTRTVPSLLVELVAIYPLFVMCCREVQKSLAESSFQSIRQEIYRQGRAEQFDIVESKGVIRSKSGGRFTFLGLLQHTVDSIKSYEGYHWAWIEEAQSVSKKSLEVLIPTLRTDGYFKHDEFVFPLRMFIYTLNPYSWDDPINIVLPEDREDTQYITINYSDNPWFPESLEKERIEAKRTMAAEEYLRIWEGIPYNDGERVVMPRAAVSGAMERIASLDGGIVTGADIARFGTDRTVFFRREGMQVVDKLILSGKDTQEVASRLREFSKGGRIVIDDTGVGGGVTDRLKALGCSVTPINFGGAPKRKKKYPDIISEMWFEMSEKLDKIGMPWDNDLMAELTSRNFKYTADERRKVESKEEYRKRTGRRSPDLADAMILCFYERGGTMSGGGL